MDKRKQQREEFLNQMLNEVYKIPVEEVVGSVVELVPRGRYLMGLCPFHPDHNLGSFIVTPDIGLWRCFAEGIGGNSVKFVMEYDDIPYLQAAFKLAREYNIISDEEYRQYSGKKWDERTVRQIQNRLEEPKQKPSHRANEKVIACVYNSIARVCQLSEPHKKHLKRDRKLKESEMKDYFTFPTRRMDLAGKVYRDIGEQFAKREYGKRLNELSSEEAVEITKRMNVIEKEFPYVPGFFYNNNTGKVDFASYKGIGMLVRDDRKMPVGIQIRRENIKKGESRYIWFSSAFAEGQEYTTGGASSGSPGGFIPAKKKKGKIALAITEGKFKAEKIADGGCDAVYVSGVSTWKSIIPIVKRVRQNRNKIFLMFDADMLGNVAVYKQLHALNSELQSLGIQTVLALWSKSNGKGIDDLIINKGQNYTKYLTYMPYDQFEKQRLSVLRQVMGIFCVDNIRELPDELKAGFETELQEMMETSLHLKQEH